MTFDSPSYVGMTASMQTAGALVFTCIVIVVNMKLFISSFEITWWLILLVMLSILSYFVCFWFLTWYSAAADDFDVFMELVTFA